MEGHGTAEGRKLCLGDRAEAFLFLPESESPSGAVIILHERYGLVQHTLDLAQKLAASGFVALAPDLFSTSGSDRETLSRGDERVALADPECAAVLNAWIDYLKQHERVLESRIALMGVCQSGRYPIVVASQRRDLAACVVFYGAAKEEDWNPSELQPLGMADMIQKISTPSFFVFGEADHVISISDVLRIRDALEGANQSYRMKVFSGMPHGFLNDTMPGRYRAKETGEAWNLLEKFLADVFSADWPNGRVIWDFHGDISADYDFSRNVRLE